MKMRRYFFIQTKMSYSYFLECLFSPKWRHPFLSRIDHENQICIYERNQPGPS